MNILDWAVLGALSAFLLLGIYRGFLPSIFSLVADIISWASGMIFMPLVAGAVKANAKIFGMLLYYTEGSEFIGDVELAKTSVDAISSSQLDEIVSHASLPFPFANEVMENVNGRVFASTDVMTLGDYFNQTIVCVVINILAFLVIFAAVRIVLGFIINGVDYAVQMPRLRQFNLLISSGCGILRGIVAMFIVFMFVPLVLIVLDFDFIHKILDNSMFAPFFYHSSILLKMIPGI